MESGEMFKMGLPMGDIVRVVNESDNELPKRATSGSEGYDLRANLDQDVTIPIGEIRLIPTGLYMKFPTGVYAKVMSRSGLAAKNGVFVLNAPGIIDNDYIGEIKVILANFGNEDFTVKKGDRIAQILFDTCIKDMDFQLVENLDTEENVRGSGGFGSTGVV